METLAVVCFCSWRIMWNALEISCIHGGWQALYDIAVMKVIFLDIATSLMEQTETELAPI